jgi:uncharacterized protein YdiU (UPF0061 family)
MIQDLSSIEFKNEFVNNFNGDESGSAKPRQTPGKFYSTAVPTPVPRVSLLGWSDDLAEELEIKKPAPLAITAGSENVADYQRDLDILGGNFISPSMQPYAACYGGHQFGNWAGQLGDGRAITLGELVTSKNKKWELQLKGPGPTAYSRRADGRAVLRSSVREYLMSEAMHYLGCSNYKGLKFSKHW